MKISYELPAPFKEIVKKYPDVCEAFKSRGTQCHNAGPLDTKERKLAKLGIAIGAGSEGAVHSAVRNALQAEVSKEEIMHVGIITGQAALQGIFTSIHFLSNLSVETNAPFFSFSVSISLFR